MEQNLRYCGKCKSIKEFVGRSSMCKDCSKEYHKQYTKANRKRINLKTVERRRKQGEIKIKTKRRKTKEELYLYGRNLNLKNKYNLTTEDYNLMFEKQKGCCAICGIHQSELNKVLCVDHDHETNENRGLLCFNCNIGLGKFKDKIEYLEKALKYLKRG